MKEFNILLVGDFLSEKEIIVALNSFEEFYHSVTFKHQRKIKLTIVESEHNFVLLNQKIKVKNIRTACNLVSPNNETTVKQVLQQSSIMFLPTATNITKLIPVAFENGLPIVGISTSSSRELIDNTCSRMIENSLDIEYEFSKTLNMLFFDPEAMQILVKGSLERYNKEYNWGRSKADAV